MKAIFTSAVLTLVFGASTLFAQSTVAPEEGAVQIGAFQMNLDALAAPQPDIQYSTDATGNFGSETTVWATSDGGIQVTVTTDNVAEWKSSDPMYHNASTDYTYSKLGAQAVWVANEMGYHVEKEKTKVHLVRATAQVKEGEKNYAVHEQGTQTEVSLLKEDGTQEVMTNGMTGYN